MIVDKSKKYRTHDGREVRIYAVDGGGDYPVHGAVLIGKAWTSETWTSEGLTVVDGESFLDLIEVKPRIKRDVWVNVYGETGAWAAHDTREDADECASRNRIACVKLTIDCEEGEGL